ncbi:MAG: Glutaryl-7-aminocephalosporanic-acid acylase precursor [Candidatus Hydrogenedentes bacterium ADurb.Bin101]|nr:MAG: Glutaryl-7-aminocephalosporanic-acid acylase precursor [Candidatus Hydrogenedentes bacterium ADurb.Bin101]
MIQQVLGLQKKFWVVILSCFVGLAWVGCHLPKQDYASFIPSPGKYDVRILRDTWGVPHIFGKTDADAAYGLAYAHCEDDWTCMEDAMLIARGELARKLGLEWAKFDYLMQWFKVREFTEERYDSMLSPELRAIVEAYAEGITHFAAAHPDKMPHLLLPVTGKDVIAGVTGKVPFFYELHSSLLAMMGNSGISIDKSGPVVFRAMEENPFSRGFPIGSNAWAVGPKRSADGATRLAINSHMPWDGQLTWYEAQVHSEEGWDVIGATFPGGPMIFKGHNANMGWCHTINRPGLADIYELVLHPDDPYRYRYDGEWRELERGKARMKVRLWGNLVVPVTREMLWSVHGPVVRQGDKAYALRFVGFGEVNVLEQWRLMNKAQNLDDFLAAMNRLTMLSFNTLYADREGNLFYAYGAKFPKRSTEFDWTKMLPGDTSKAVWTEFHPFPAIPQVLNPPSAFIQSCNSGPFHTTVGEGNPGPEDFCPSMRIETHLTNRSRRALALYGADEAITREEFYTYKYDKGYDPESATAKWVRKVLTMKPPEDPNIAAALEILKGWDHSGDRNSTGTALVMLAREMDHAEDADEMECLCDAAHYLLEKYGRLDVPWEEMLRLRRGDLDLGLGGCPDCLRAIDIKLQDDGRFAGINGDCFFQMVEWGADGTLRSESIHQYGSAAADKDSPHYADQAPLFAAEQMRPTLYYEKDIRENLALEYRPGDYKEPWYRAVN